MNHHPRPVGPSLVAAALTVVLLGGSVLAGSRAAVLYQGRTDKPEIALTIDDGDSTSVCRQMVRTLRRKHAPATFFPVGRNVAAHPSFWRNVAQDFALGNHTMHHADLAALDSAAIKREILRSQRIIERATGRAILPVLRPPYGAWDRKVQNVAGTLGYKVLLTWDTSAADTSLHSKASGMLRAALRGTNGSVVLMHCNRSVTAQILPKIIDGYRKRGYRLVTVARLLRRVGYPVRAPRL